MNLTLSPLSSVDPRTANDRRCLLVHTREAWALDASLSLEGKPRLDRDESCPHLLFAVVVFFDHVRLDQDSISGVHACCTLVQVFCLISVFLRPGIVGLCLCVHVVSPLSTSQQAGIGRDVVFIVARTLLRPAKSPTSHSSFATVFAHLTNDDLLDRVERTSHRGNLQKGQLGPGKTNACTLLCADVPMIRTRRRLL